MHSRWPHPANIKVLRVGYDFALKSSNQVVNAKLTERLIALFLDVTQRRMVVRYRRFGTTYRSFERTGGFQTKGLQLALSTQWKCKQYY